MLRFGPHEHHRYPTTVAHETGLSKRREMVQSAVHHFRRTLSRTTYERHRLSISVVKTMPNNQPLKDDLYLAYLAHQFPTGDYQNWDICEQLLPHVEKIVDKLPSNPRSLEAWTEVLTNLAWYL